jgi:hypothetical protein
LDSVLDKQRRARSFSLRLKLSDVDKIELFTHAQSQVKRSWSWFPRVGRDHSNCKFESDPFGEFSSGSLTVGH